MKPELVPHVTKDDILLGTVERAQAYKEGLVHRAAHAFIRNSEGLFLLQQRSQTKSAWPNLTDLSLGETVQPEESYVDAFRRGAREELGAEVSNIELIRERYYQEYFWKDYKAFVVVCLYLATVTQELNFFDGEVASASWLTEEQVSEYLDEHPENCTPWLLADWKYAITRNVF